jgi:hypothetical protein
MWRLLARFDFPLNLAWCSARFSNLPSRRTIVRSKIHSTQELFMNHNFFCRKAAHWGLLKDNIFERRFNIRTHFTELFGYAQRSRPVRISLVLLLVAIVCFAQDPFSALGAGAQTISTGTFVTGCVELAIVVGGILLAFSGRVLGGVLIAIIGGGMLALSATKWMGWIQSL